MFSSSQKGVLYLTDDALYVYKVSGRTVLLKDMFDWEQEDILESLTRILKKGFASVVILNDTVDQHYRKERIPKVGALDASSVIKRRLAMAFPEFPIRSFQKISDDSDGKEGGRVMGHFLFCACPDNSNIRVVTSAIRDSGVSFKGVALLPMESVGLVTDLVQGISRKKTGFMAKKKEKNDDVGWFILMGQNASGGLRQIVVKNGQLALTRISPIVETDADVALWCDEVRRELDSTMGYLSRFGYKDEDSLNIVIIGSEKASSVFDEIMDVDADIHVISLDNAMKTVGISAPTNELDHIANVLHVGWVAKKSSLSSPMKSGLINSIMQPRTAATAIAAILVLGLVGSMYYAANSVVALNSSLENLKVAQARQKQVNLVFDKEIERKEALGINIKLIQSSFDVHSEIEEDLFDPLDTIEKIGRAMKGTLRLDSIYMTQSEVAPDVYGYVAPRPQGEDSVVPSETVLKFSFPGTIDIVQGNNQVIAFSKRLEKEFEGAEVVVTRILKDVSYRGELQSEVGVTAQEKISADLEAEIVIKQGGA